MKKELKDFGKNKSFFFVGIGGAGMSAVATVLKGMGFFVSGSDLKESSYTKNLKKKEIPVFIGHNSKNILDFDALIISTAIKKDNVEYKAAISSGIPVYTRADALAWILNQKQSIAVAGTHGKTTTTSMISFMLKKMELDPTIIIGGELNELGTNASFGKGKYIVAEACESDGSFIQYKPYISIVTNIEEDHLDFYNDFEEIRKNFISFMNNTRAEGFIIINGDDIEDEMLAGLKNEKTLIRFGLSEKNDVFAYDIKTEIEGTRFKIKVGHAIYDTLLKLPGLHNVKNCLACIACSYALGLDIEKCIKIIEGFSGVKRRFEIRGNFNNSIIVDDYAHHPTEIKATLEAAQSLLKDRVITVFQPHRYSRLQAILSKYNDCFEKTDTLIITEVYASGEDPIIGVSGKSLIDFLFENDFAKKLVYIPKITDIIEYLKQEIKKDDLVLVMGAGDITRVTEGLLEH